MLESNCTRSLEYNERNYEVWIWLDGSKNYWNNFWNIKHLHDFC